MGRPFLGETNVVRKREGLSLKQGLETAFHRGITWHWLKKVNMELTCELLRTYSGLVDLFYS